MAEESGAENTLRKSNRWMVVETTTNLPSGEQAIIAHSLTKESADTIANALNVCEHMLTTFEENTLVMLPGYGTTREVTIGALDAETIVKLHAIRQWRPQ